jgi:redox-sensitive bicupin YhaK (pirin superfamily)
VLRNFGVEKNYPMDRKSFIRNGLLGTGIFLTPGAVAGLHLNNIDELAPLDVQSHPDVVGFNHIPNPTSSLMANMVLHKAATRGHANHGWLDSHHSFSFANYYNPDRMHFGALRVLNDDRVDPGMGFGTHPHDNMEIISIPLEGDLEHRDSMNNVAVIKHGDVQVMSAGTGITHSEYNRNKDKLTKFLQIWLFPNKRNVQPRYDQISLKSDDRHNKFQQILSPSPDDEGVWIHQDAWFHLGKFDKDVVSSYDIKRKGNGVYAFVISGRVEIEGQMLESRDGLGIWDAEQIRMVSAAPGSEILLMDVPMSI